MKSTDVDAFLSWRNDLMLRLSKTKHIPEPPFKIREKIEMCLKYKHPIPSSIREVYGAYISAIKYNNR